MSENKPIDIKLYEKVKKEAIKKFKSYPSIYSSSWLVREYKKRGGRYSGKRNKDGLLRWYKEKWINACKLPLKVPCGRDSVNNKEKYPYCRPSVRVTKDTPKTIDELGEDKLKKLCAKKRRYPGKRIMS